MRYCQHPRLKMFLYTFLFLLVSCASFSPDRENDSAQGAEESLEAYLPAIEYMVYCLLDAHNSIARNEMDEKPVDMMLVQLSLRQCYYYCAEVLELLEPILEERILSVNDKDLYLAFCLQNSRNSPTPEEVLLWAQKGLESNCSELSINYRAYLENELVRYYTATKKTTEALYLYSNLFPSIAIDYYDVLAANKGSRNDNTAGLYGLLEEGYYRLKQAGISEPLIWETVEAKWRKEHTWNEHHPPIPRKPTSCASLRSGSPR